MSEYVAQSRLGVLRRAVPPATIWCTDVRPTPTPGWQNFGRPLCDFGPKFPTDACHSRPLLPILPLTGPALERISLLLLWRARPPPARPPDRPPVRRPRVYQKHMSGPSGPTCRRCGRRPGGPNSIRFGPDAAGFGSTLFGTGYNLVEIRPIPAHFGPHFPADPVLPMPTSHPNRWNS